MFDSVVKGVGKEAPWGHRYTGDWWVVSEACNSTIEYFAYCEKRE